MFEDTNQTEAQEVLAENTAEEEMFADYTPLDTDEDDETATDNEAGADIGENQVDAQGAEPEKHKVVYNGQEVMLTLDELKTNAQKGMNYDHIYGQLQQIKSSPVLSVFERYAQKNGMTSEQYAEYLQNLETRQQVMQMTQQGVPEETAKRLIELEKREQERSAREEEAKKQADRQRQFSDFMREYPDVQAADIPQEVWQRFNGGMDLIAAYAIYENRQLKTEVQQHKQNETNKQKSVGSAQSDNSDTNADAFLAGLLG